MKKIQLRIEKNEYHWLLGVINNQNFTDPLNQSSLENLLKNLEQANIKDEADMPFDVVRLNSMVSIETPYGPKEDLQLVVPAERDSSEDKISVLSPMGSALIGYSKGDEVDWIFPKGEGKINIIQVKNAPIKIFN